MYERKPADVDKLKEIIIQCSNMIKSEILQKVIDNLYVQYRHHQIAGGQQLEHLFK